MKELYNEEYFEGNGSNYGCGSVGGYGSENIIGLFKYITQFILRVFHPRSILDIGCAYGYLTKSIKHGLSYGIDISRYAITEKRVTDRVFLASASYLPFKSNCFDLITCLETLEHLTEEEIHLAFHEVDRVGKKWFYMTSPSKDNPDMDKDKTHISIWSKEKWLELGESMGWESSTKMLMLVQRFPVVRLFHWDFYVFDLKGKI